MILVPFIAGGVPPTQSSLDIDSAAGELSDSSGFSELLDMFGAAIEPAETADETLRDGEVEFAPALSRNGQASDDKDEVSNDSPALVSLLNPVTIDREKIGGITADASNVDVYRKLSADDQSIQSADEVLLIPPPANLSMFAVTNLIALESTAPLASGARANGARNVAHRAEQVNFANLPSVQTVPPPQSIELSEPANPPAIEFQSESNGASLVADEVFLPRNLAVVPEPKKPAHRAKTNSDIAVPSNGMVSAAGGFESSENEALFPTDHTPSRSAAMLSNPSIDGSQTEQDEASLVAGGVFSPASPGVLQEPKKLAHRDETDSDIALPSNAIFTAFAGSETSETSENQPLFPTNYTPSRSAASMSNRSIDGSQTDSANVVEKTRPIVEMTSVHAEPIESVKSAESPVIHDVAHNVLDIGAVAPRRTNLNKGELQIDGERRDDTESVSVSREFAPVETRGSEFQSHSDSHAESFQRDARSFAEHGDFKLSKDRVEQVDTAVRHFVPDRIGPATVPLQHHENISGAASATAWRPVIDRVADEIIGHVQIGKNEAVLQLDPPELGKIKIDLWVDGGGIHARIVADEQSTKALIESHLPELHQALDAGRVELVNLHVDHQETARGTEQWAQGFDDNARQGRRHGQSHGGAVERTLNDSSSTENSTHAPGDTGRISMWA